MRKKLSAIAAAAMLSFSLVACAQGSTTDASDTQAEATEEEATTQDASVEEDAQAVEATVEPSVATTIGETAPDAVKIKVSNAIGKDITGFAMRRAGETEWGQNLLQENEVIKSEGTVELGIAADDAAESYDLQLTDVDGSVVEVTGLALKGMSEVTLCVDEGVGYATFLDLDGNEGSTKAADESADLAAPQDTSEEAYVEPTYYEETYTEPTYYEETYTEPTYTEPTYEETYTAPEQSADDCTRDNIVLE